MLQILGVGIFTKHIPESYSVCNTWISSSNAFQEVVPDWQNAASGLLVALGEQYCDEVMSEMFERFQPGTLPHYFVVRTIGNLAQANGNYRKSNLSCK